MNNQSNNNQGGNNQSNQPRLKKIKRPVNRMAPQMPQQNSGSTAGGQPNKSNNQPLKVKRPINRMPPQMPNTEYQRVSNLQTDNSNNEAPFADAFGLDQFNDSNQNLPVARNTPTNAQADNQQQYQPHFLGQESADDFDNANNGYADVRSGATYDLKVVIMSALVALVVGFIMTKFLFADQKIVKDGLQGVVLNPEVPRGRARCGLAERTQGCVLYMMNPQRQELNARDFYDLASQLTGRQRFVIETGNMRYSNTKIRPGDIGQFNIPPLTQ